MDLLIEQKSSTSFIKIITPILIAVFTVYLAIGMTLGVLPTFIQHDLKTGSIIVGIIIGAQSFATLLTRAYAGKSLIPGGQTSVNPMGVMLTLATGIIYILAALLGQYTVLALSLFLVARIIHGISESLSITGALTWGIALLGAENSGKVMTWNGIAMYAGIAIGAPVSIWMVKNIGPAGTFAMIVVLALISWGATMNLPVVTVNKSQVRAPFFKVVSLIANQGSGLAFSSMGFACIASFISLFFAEKNWGDVSMAFLSFGAFYILTRVFFASLPDKFGGYKVAAVSFVIEIIGQGLIFTASSRIMAIAGCALTGIGFSLIFPALGVLAIKKVNPHMRGNCFGRVCRFFDLSLGIAGPIAGLVASYYNYQAVYLFSGISCLLALLLLLFNNRN